MSADAHNPDEAGAPAAPQQHDSNAALKQQMVTATGVTTDKQQNSQTVRSPGASALKSYRHNERHALIHTCNNVVVATSNTRTTPR